MAKKKAVLTMDDELSPPKPSPEPSADPDPSPVPPVERERGWKGELIRQIAQEYPGMTQKQMADEFNRRTGETVTLQTVASAIGSKKRGTVPALPSPVSPPTLDDINHVLSRLKADNLKAGDLLDSIRAVSDLAEEVGDLQNLRKILEFIDSL